MTQCCIGWTGEHLFRKLLAQIKADNDARRVGPYRGQIEISNHKTDRKPAPRAHRGNEFCEGRCCR